MAECLKWAYFALATSLHVLANVSRDTLLILFKYLVKIPTK